MKKYADDAATDYIVECKCKAYSHVDKLAYV